MSIKEQSPTRPYVLTQDSSALFFWIKRDPRVFEGQFQRAADTYLTDIATTLINILDPDIRVLVFNEEAINQRLSAKVEPLLQKDPNALCISLDRFLLSDLEERYKGQFTRFSMCRTINGQREPRQGAKTFPEQFDLMETAVPNLQKRKIILVDDGLFTGESVKEFIGLSKARGLNVTSVIGFIGNEKPSSIEQDPEKEIIEAVPELYEWIDIRDFSPLGGKKLAASRSNRITASVPYLFPWNDGEAASLNMSPGFFGFSIEAIKAFQRLVITYEEVTDSTLIFRQLIEAGYPLPTDIAKTIPVSINQTVVNYMDKCIELIKSEQEREVMVFDMDGTLYQLDGKNNGYLQSSLESAVLQNAKRFIVEKETCTDSEAQFIIEQALRDPTGMSMFLAKQYSISREDYFNVVWNIDPSGIVRNYQEAVASVKQIKERDQQIKLILLTAAPNIWAKRVLNFLGLTECFEMVCTGEQYKTKRDIFRMLAGRYKAEKVTSIGDQQQTDLEPAAELGMTTLLVKQPADLKLLIQ